MPGEAKKTAGKEHCFIVDNDIIICLLNLNFPWNLFKTFACFSAWFQDITRFVLADTPQKVDDDHPAKYMAYSCILSVLSYSETWLFRLWIADNNFDSFFIYFTHWKPATQLGWGANAWRRARFVSPKYSKCWLVMRSHSGQNRANYQRRINLNE